ncbi:Xenobiotic-transporting ATPase [Oleidesulfovibrio alaskensis G20]|jgi:ATP-binding cassette subfamily B protein|uniref:Xenobiotic-transporting ATPase n=1 Tax=Oleidesulfovibrio alaskensis (strain ATCC BAA-1058 / DSM 17464 / G20) TaxID=207559 RepID=Q311J7_OLEA2|nr:ABC transporter ATP-binding protein [Oleidesulfovibrio alaskensis]ABB38399.1 Xenobiotic-transporting ATPase [Oleidesulfovibrio alaskensis G20]MBG0773347.1 ABC transporter ATP-binding protein [Oleidesulfovibrio alaskensis]
MQMYKKVIVMTRGNHFLLGFAAFFAILDVLFELIPYFAVYSLVIHTTEGTLTEHAVAVHSGIVLCAIILRTLSRWASAVSAHKAGYRTLYNIRIRLADHIGKLPGMYFTRQSTGNLHKIMTEDVERIENLLCHHLPDLFASIAAPLFTLAVFFAVDWRLALFALCPLLLAVLCQRILAKEAAKHMHTYHAAMGAMTDSIMEYTRGITLIKSFNRTARTFTRFTDSVHAVRDVMITWNKNASTFYALFGTSLISGIVFVLPPGIWLYSGHGLTFESLFLFLLLVSGYALPLDRLSRFASKLRQIEEGVGKIDEVLSTPPLPPSRTNLSPRSGDIQFSKVTFGYTPDAPFFQNISFTIPYGRLTALVGPSGAGKTTAAQLIARMQDVWSGSISLGGDDLRDLNQEQLFEHIAFVFQDTFLLSDSAMANIRAARPDASDAEVIHAATMAKAHEFIASLPQGYATPLGDGGVPLSGGERQRIAIARAFLKDAPIVILDEATAYTDPENEVAIQQALSTLLARKTVIVIAHRLSTITEADKIIVFDNGSVAETGKHDSLVANGGVYSRLWAAQQASDQWGFNMPEEQHA